MRVLHLRGELRISRRELLGLESLLLGEVPGGSAASCCKAGYFFKEAGSRIFLMALSKSESEEALKRCRPKNKDIIEELDQNIVDQLH